IVEEPLQPAGDDESVYVPPPKPKGRPAAHDLPIPWVRVRSAASGHQLFKRMLGEVDPKARPGDMVAVYDRNDAPYGVALYNPRSLIALRLLTRGIGKFDPDAFFAERLGSAVEFRRGALGLDAVTDAYRLVHDHGDGLPGLVVDRYGDCVVLEFYSLGMYKAAARIEKALKVLYPSARFFHRASPHTQSMEGFTLKPNMGNGTRVKENGVTFLIDPSSGYKTGFFTDQRDNRMAMAPFARGKKVLDVCSYTGGFALYAKKLGGADEVTAVELDPEAGELMKKNANANNVRIDSVTADAFPYLRQAGQNARRYGLMILDPYKLIANQEGWALGRQKYIDLNRLGISLMEPGGILVTCSCSGMLPWEEFMQFVRTAAGSAGRRVQIFRKSGAGADHPFAADHPEGEYLKVLWCRVL
ncbi:MAG: class I SAM-dependent rRNA methyltransferase, partial [Elusimicrobia bacterium]|nr:class I SAM-dependent rRNA methyltransferase [Elusimicrobiota bacterium]